MRKRKAPGRGAYSKSPHGSNARRQWCSDGPNGRPCDPCRAAHALEMKLGNEERRRRLAEDFNVVEHGHGSTYDNWGCRCDECMAAKRLIWAARRVARIEPFGREWLRVESS